MPLDWYYNRVVFSRGAFGGFECQIGALFVALLILSSFVLRDLVPVSPLS